jgi:hypothetical protein
MAVAGARGRGAAPCPAMALQAQLCTNGRPRDLGCLLGPAPLVLLPLYASRQEWLLACGWVAEAEAELHVVAIWLGPDGARPQEAMGADLLSRPGHSSAMCQHLHQQGMGGATTVIPAASLSGAGPAHMGSRSSKIPQTEQNGLRAAHQPHRWGTHLKAVHKPTLPVGARAGAQHRWLHATR